jgi:16S rRNA (guanine527-N7)-methyltransferase
VSEPLRPDPDPELVARLRPLIALLTESPHSLTSVRDVDEAEDVHIADSLSGLLIPELAEAERIVDIGSGAGFPGLPMAVALPRTQFDLLDSVKRKAGFIEEAIPVLGCGNAKAVWTRSEDWAKADGFEAYDAVTARAVAPLAVLCELACPLLREGGVLVAWKGARDPAEEREARAAMEILAMELDRVESVVPFESSRIRHLFVVRKTGPTPDRIPRRAGMARKRPLTG